MKRLGRRLGVARVHAAARVAGDGVRDVGWNARLVHEGDERRAQGVETRARGTLVDDADGAEGGREGLRRALPRGGGEEEVPVGGRLPAALDDRAGLADERDEQKALLAVADLVGLGWRRRNAPSGVVSPRSSSATSERRRPV